MAAQTASNITIVATPAEIMAVIADFGSYPEWATSVKVAEVLAVDAETGRAAEVHFVLDAGLLHDDYRLCYTWDGDREVRWSLVEAKVLKALEGSYTLTYLDQGQTDVHYRLVVDIAIPLLGLIRRKAEKIIIETALIELKKRVEQA